MTFASVRLTRRHLLAASAINGAGFILASAATVLWYFLIVKRYSAAESGRLLLAMSVAGMINLIDFGTSMGLTRLLSVSEQPADRSMATRAFRSAIWLGSALQLLVGSVALIVWRHLTDVPPPLAASGAIVVFAVSFQIVLTCASAMKGICDFKAANLISTGSALLVYGVAAALAAASVDIWMLFLAMSGVQLAMAAFAIRLATSRLATLDSGSTSALSLLRAYGALLKTSLTFFPQMVTGIFFMHAQRFVIAKYSGLEAVAVVSFAYSVATRIHSLVNAFLEVLFPMAQRLQQQGVKVGRLLVKVGLMSALSYALVAFVTGVVAAFVIPEALWTFAVFALGVTFAIAAAPAFHALNGSGASAQVSTCSFISPFLFVAVAEGIHPRMGTAELLLPSAYAIAMAFMLLQVGILAWRHLQQRRLAPSPSQGR